MTPMVQSSAISAGADILSGAFGGSSNARAEKDLRSQYTIARQYAPSLQAANIAGKVRGAKEAGLHPLFAMGASPGQSPTFSMPGQSPEGSFAQSALKGISGHYSRMAEYEAKKDLINAQAQASALRVAENNIGNDVDYGSPMNQPINPALQEFKKGEVVANDPKSKQKGMGVRPLTNAITVGDQQIQFVAEEGADLMEDPVKNLVTAYFDRNNTGVQWRRAIRDFAGIRHPESYSRQKAFIEIVTPLFWGLVKTKKRYEIPRYMGR